MLQRFKGELLVSPEDLPLVRGRRVVLGSHGYLRIGRELLHRLIMKPKEGEHVDHINRNKLDNRRENLRLVSKGLNQINRTDYRNTSGVSGVFLIQETGRWRSFIGVNGKRKYLLLTSDFFEAVCARKSAENSLFEKACCN